MEQVNPHLFGPYVFSAFRSYFMAVAMGMVEHSETGSVFLSLLHQTTSMDVTIYLTNALLHASGLHEHCLSRPALNGIETTERLDHIQALRARGIYQ